MSRFRLRTRARGALAGTEIRIDGGQARASVKEIGAPEGTLVEVDDLFFNLPARRKFLKADTAEAAQVSRLVTQLALGYPDVGFMLRSGERVLLEAPPAAVARRALLPDLRRARRPCRRSPKQAAGIAVTGFVAALADQGPARGPQHVFVNRRIVRDRTIAHAIQQAYSVATIKERSPEVHLFIELPPDRVDVNVHPTKAEVRFLDQGLVHEVLRRAIVDALGARDGAGTGAVTDRSLRRQTDGNLALPLSRALGSMASGRQSAPAGTPDGPAVAAADSASDPAESLGRPRASARRPAVKPSPRSFAP